MREENFEYIAAQVKYSGFGEEPASQIRQNIEAGAETFSVNVRKKVEDAFADAELHFSRSKEHDFYFFNRFDLSVHKPESPDIMQNTFNVYKSHGYTLKEAYNMLHGRAAYIKKKNTEGKEYYTWDMLDLSDRNKHGNHPILTYGESRGFRMEQELDKMPIKGVSHPDDLKSLHVSLERGNLQHVRFGTGDDVSSLYLAANPKRNRIDIFDADGKLVSHSLEYESKQKIERPEQSQREKKGAEQSLKSKIDDGTAKKKQGRKSSQSA